MRTSCLGAGQYWRLGGSPSLQVTGPVAPGPVCNQTLCEGLAPTCRPGHRLLTHFQEDSCCPSYSCGEWSKVGSAGGGGALRLG